MRSHNGTERYAVVEIHTHTHTHTHTHIIKRNMTAVVDVIHTESVCGI